jgi:hypothetical protein
MLRDSPTGLTKQGRRYIVKMSSALQPRSKGVLDIVVMVLHLAKVRLTLLFHVCMTMLLFMCYEMPQPQRVHVC